MKPLPLKGRTWNPYTIPDVIDPGGVRCIKVYIPDSLQWLQIFAAVMDTMCHWKNYELLGDTSAAQCAALMRSIMQQYNTFVGCDECPPSTIIEEMEYQMSVCEQLRFQNGKLQGLCCGEWSDISGQPAQGWTAGPTGTGSTPPTSGACENYNAVITGNGYWYAPFTVNTGDTLVISEALGATYNPANGGWYCPDGSLFFGGACLASTLIAAGNPMPAVLSGKLIAKIGATYYDVYGGTFTVPAGITAQGIQFQFNYASIATSSGTVNFKVQFCNQSVSSWNKFLDFRLSPQGFAADTTGNVSGTPATWSASVGWVFGDVLRAGPEYFRSVVIKRSGITPFNGTQMDVLLSLTKGAYFGGGAEYGLQARATAGATNYDMISILNPSIANGNNQTKSGSLAAPATNELKLTLTAATSGPGNTLTGNAIIAGLTIYGTGVNPF